MYNIIKTTYILTWIDTPHVFIIYPQIFFGNFNIFHYFCYMKTKSIIYNSFVPNAEITPAISQDSSPSFKYTGYKPRYK